MLGRRGTIVDCQEVDPGIVVGQLATVSDLPRGINAVLNLCAEAQPIFMDPQMPLESWQGGELVAYARMGILDGLFPGLVWLETAVNQVLTWKVNDWRTAIFCAAGISRSGMVATAVLMTLHGWSRDRALEHIQKKRPQVNPNASFMGGLHEFGLGLDSKLGGTTIPGGLMVLDGEVKNPTSKEAT